MIRANITTQETERLYIRRVQLSDAPFLHSLMHTEKWTQHIGDKGCSSVESTRQYIASKMDENVWAKGYVSHVMIAKNSSLQIGTCSLQNRNGIDGLDIGCALLPEFERKGYATEGVKSMINLAFDHYHQVKVSAITAIDNVRSFEGLERIGFIFKGLIQLPYCQGKIKLYQYNRKI
ncbi:MAG: GNAT family N-acetyltransferase [Cyclobacteriaceae bacterium]